MSTERAESSSAHAVTKKIIYNDRIARQFVAASVGWGVVALLLGVVIALQLAFWQANVASYFSFGRLRPLHTNAAIFAFVGNMLFAGVYYSTQRLIRTRIASDALASIHFWGWQAIIVAAAVTLPLGFTQGKEYAELEWPIDISIAIVWVVFAINFFWTLYKRHEKHLYVAIWFYIATIVTVAVLHIVNSLAIPVSAFKSYSVFAGAQDALVQWWYGHNAVAFFLTTPILGIMYYFVPKAADRPVYSYRLSIIHFWALVFIYIWAGPHHLLNTALPDWAQTLGMIFSVMLWAPSWGGMINGLLTMRGAWDKLREDPVLKFFAAGLTFYGMATFEGPLLSIKSVSGLAHYTDWIVGHVHSGALGWNGFMAAGMFYWMVPRLFGTQLYSRRLADIHFYLGTFGILLYVIAMWISGITQGLMWRATTPQGELMYPSFVETLLAIRPMYWMRLIGGLMYLVGFIMMAYNLLKTAKQGKAVDGETQVVVETNHEESVPWHRIVFGAPAVLSVIAIALLIMIGFSNEVTSGAFLVLLITVGAGGIFLVTLSNQPGKPTWHRLLEGRSLIFTSFTIIAVLIGGVAEILPTLIVRKADATGMSKTHPYTPLELEGRDVYLREGCYNCHSQMIRPFRFETKRYGNASELDDSKYDHPFQWGSKRTGPDLAREGERNPSASWHYKHMIDPRSISEGSNMPAYPSLATTKIDFNETINKVRAMRSIGVPYTPEQVQHSADDARKQATMIVHALETEGIKADQESQLIALIAFLQRLGKQPEITKPESSSHVSKVNVSLSCEKGVCDVSTIP